MIGNEESVVEDSYQVLNWLENMSIIAGSGMGWLEPVATGWTKLDLLKHIGNDWQWGICVGGQLPHPQLAGGYVNYSWVWHRMFEIGWNWLNIVGLVETHEQCWHWGVCCGGKLPSPQLAAGEYVNFSWVWHGMVGTGWNRLNIVGLVETHWQWLAVRRLW